MLKALLIKIRSILISAPMEERTHPYENLFVLIERCEARLLKHLGHKPFCPHCNHIMELRHSSITGAGIGYAQRGAPLRDDQGWKCIHCFHTTHFGVPITRKVAMEELKLRRGIHLSRPTYRRDERTRQDVKERLKQLGYLDFGE